jgi:hypothetical protein
VSLSGRSLTYRAKVVPQRRKVKGKSRIHGKALFRLSERFLGFPIPYPQPGLSGLSEGFLWLQLLKSEVRAN